MAKIKIPKKYFEIVKEKKKPTRYIMEPSTGLLKGRLERGDKRKKGLIYGKKAGDTRIIRMTKSYKGFSRGQVVSRTKKSYPGQINSVLIRVPKRIGRITGITVVKEHKRRSKKGMKHRVRRYERKR